eukprot:gnl/MRDRNA2_/MRDRNA2_71491_c0_seq1.p1 gnl/MRDRNA2_/MRDRNA2_71491_c0~~gnl/MRDRNA2_/MRDRNA2_71491_c0_seq1.p1  ORF type:complete len:179 (+),score=40.05 gnl/MRDRNA2_/MRDRNA2_71491_c0_seq1:132-668(+)
MDGLPDFQEQPHLLMIPLIALAAMVYLVLQNRKTPKFIMHKYQRDFLDKFAAAQCLSDASKAFQSIVEQAMDDHAIQKDIFDTFHCVHCGSVNPQEWISKAKGKQPYDLDVSPQVVAFLGRELLVKVEKVGEPPTRQVVPGPKRADPDKAARCCIDWAIKNMDNIDLTTGKFRSKKVK